jgi:SulP family sulfate permease
VALVVLLAGPYARFIPKAALAGLLFITAARLIDWKRIQYTLRASRYDASLVLVTCFSAVFISVDSSVLIGVVLSIVLQIATKGFSPLSVERIASGQKDADQNLAQEGR